MHILFSFSDNRIVWGMYKNNSALTFHLDRGIHRPAFTTLTKGMYASKGSKTHPKWNLFIKKIIGSCGSIFPSDSWLSLRGMAQRRMTELHSLQRIVSIHFQYEHYLFKGQRHEHRY